MSENIYCKGGIKVDIKGINGRTFFTLNVDEIGEAIGDYIMSKYSFPKCAANVQISMNQSSDTEVKVEIPVNIDKVTKRD